MSEIVHHAALIFDGVPASALGKQWEAALRYVCLRHPNGYSKPILRILDGDPPSLYVGLDRTTCTKTGAVMQDFAISTVRLAYFPGERLAQMWIAAAWVGYLQHEALELVTVDGQAVLDPHAEPYTTNPFNRGLRDGFPVDLTIHTLVDALAVIMGRDAAHTLVWT